MGRLIYSTITSADGYIEDAEGGIDWGEPDDEAFALVNDLQRQVGTYLYGRRMYEVMVAWETITDDQPEMHDFAQLWRAADKVVYSRTLEAPFSARTRIERSFAPEAVRELKASAARDISVGGADLAAQALAAGLVDECRLFLAPVIVGGGTPSLPDHVRLDLDLLEERRFGNGMVYLRYRTRG